MSLQSAYFEQFEAGLPNVLIWGNARDMAALSAFLRRAALETNDQLALASICMPVDQRTITVRRSSSPIGMMATTDGFDWCLDPETLGWYADLVEVLANSGRPCHQYLETGMAGQITVRVSRGEYPDDLRPNVPSLLRHPRAGGDPG